jgi:DNA-binding transcriptional LysR family regulator
VELRQIESFFWIAVLGSFGGAANRLNMTQPAISSRITSLEKELGVELFDRSGRRVKLTPKGLEIFEYVEKLVELLTRIREAATGDGRLRGRLRLGVVNTIAHTWLPQLISRVECRYPKINIDFEVDISAELKTRLLSHDLDLVISVGQPSGSSIESRLLCSYSLDWIASSTLALPPEPLSLSEIAQFRLITYPKRSIPHNLIQELFKSAGIWPIRLSESNSVAAMVQIALSGIGICVIPSVVVRPQLAAGQLRVLKSEATLPPLEFYASYLDTPLNELPALVAQMADDICNEARAQDK